MENMLPSKNVFFLLVLILAVDQAHAIQSFLKEDPADGKLPFIERKEAEFKKLLAKGMRSGMLAGKKEAMKAADFQPGGRYFQIVEESPCAVLSTASCRQCNVVYQTFKAKYGVVCPAMKIDIDELTPDELNEWAERWLGEKEFMFPMIFIGPPGAPLASKYIQGGTVAVQTMDAQGRLVPLLEKAGFENVEEKDNPLGVDEAVPSVTAEILWTLEREAATAQALADTLKDQGLTFHERSKLISDSMTVTNSRRVAVHGEVAAEPAGFSS